MNTDNYFLPKEFIIEDAKTNGEQLMRLIDWSKGAKMYDEGSSRKVYRVSNDLIIKIAFNHVGFLQNAKEYEIYINAPEEHKPRLAKAHSISDNFEVMLMDFINTDIPLVDIEGNIYDYSNMSEHHHNDVDELDETISYLCNDCEILYDDLIKLNSFGVVDNKLVYIDYGLTEKNFVQYYDC